MPTPSPHATALTLADSTERSDDIRLAQSGDAAAFERLYKANAGRVFALCLRLSGDRERATELMQDAFVRAWERLGSFRRESAFSSWLHRLTVNVALNASRTESRRREARDGDDGLDVRVIPLPRLGDPGDRVDLERAIAALPSRAREAFVLHEIEGFAPDEIATMMGVAAPTVRVHLMRARRFLMEVLDR